MFEDDDSEFDKLLLATNFEERNDPVDEFDEFDDDLINSEEFLKLLDEKPNEKTPPIAEQKEICAPDDFGFPFEPYSIQKDFMQSLYRCLESGKIGIFESPTGTGKSLSIICGVLTWLNDSWKRELVESDELIASAKRALQDQNTADNWLDSFETTKELEEKAKIVEKRLAKMKLLNDRLNLVKKGFVFEPDKSKSAKRKAAEEAELVNDDENLEEVDEESVILAEYVSDDESNAKKNATLASEERDEEELYVRKVFYAVRTHSQLAQFLNELKKTKFTETFRVTTLGSRQNLCVNKAVSQLPHISLINDRCLQLQDTNAAKARKTEDGKRGKKSCKCPYFRNQAIRKLSDELLVNVQDIEELVNEGVKQKACPYYASRYAVPSADVVLMPYHILLNKSTREACDVRLKDSVVIIDEAHNLIDTLNSIHSVRLNFAVINATIVQLEMYKNRYETRLKAKNLMYIEQILLFLKSLAKTLHKLKDFDRLYKINDFLFVAGLADLNFFKMQRYIDKSRIAKKLNGFARKLAKGETDAANVCSLVQVEALIRCLLNSSKDGRIVVKKEKDGEQQSSVQFVSLNPANYFGEILAEARSVILTGGTMHPNSDLIDQIFIPAGVTQDRLVEFSCGHVVPKENILPLIIEEGPTNIQLEFSYQNRNFDLIDELGRIFVNLVKVVPAGLVCFFSSYEFENVVFQRLDSQKVIAKLEELKKVFREPKKSADVASVLEKYAQFVKTSKEGKTKYSGAILFAVVGGKMSEGINFGDDLGRCVVMIGMPYPSKHSIELQEKMKYLDELFKRIKCGQQSSSMGQQYYENLCAKAVNQSIGRAIRHRNDYSSIILLDRRYSKPSVQKRLPGWINGEVKKFQSYGHCLLKLSKFYRYHNKT